MSDTRLAKISVLLILASGFGACAPASSIPLTSDQKVAVVGLMRSTMRGLIAVPSDSVAATTTTTLTSTSIPQTVANDPSASQMQIRLRTAIQSKNCEIRWGAPGNLTPPPTGSSTDLPGVNGPVAIRVNGNLCPMVLSYTIDHPDADVVANAAQRLNYNWTYRVSDPDYQKLNDVDSVSLSGNSTGDQNSAGFTTDVRGVIHSQRYGTITYSNAGTVSGTGEQTTGALMTQVVFPAFEANFRIDFDGSKRTYTINGQEVEASELDSYFPGAVLGPSTGAFGS